VSTRLKRPAFWRHLALTLALVAFQGYLAYNVVSGQFGIENQKVMLAEIDELKGQSGALAADIEATSHRVQLFTSTRLDPDILTERARALLLMSQADDLVVMVDTATGKPISGSYDELAASQLTDEIEAGID
jgi:cell division protein FtsB